MGVEWSITLSQYRQVREAIDSIKETEWGPIGYTDDGEAQVAETFFTASAKKGDCRRVRVVVRRTRLTESAQQQLWPDWRYHAFATNTELCLVEADTFHRAHARVELAIRDIKAHGGLSHCPSGNFYAMGQHLPHHPRLCPQPPPTLLTHLRSSPTTARTQPPTCSRSPLQAPHPTRRSHRIRQPPPTPAKPSPATPKEPQNAHTTPHRQSNRWIQAKLRANLQCSLTKNKPTSRLTWCSVPVLYFAAG